MTRRRRGYQPRDAGGTSPTRTTTEAASAVPGGVNQVHIGRNLGKSPVVVDEMYVDSGKPLSDSVPNPGCPGVK